MQKIPFESVEMKCAILKVSFLFFSNEMSNKCKSNLHSFYHVKKHFIKSIIHLYFQDRSVSDVWAGNL